MRDRLSYIVKKILRHELIAGSFIVFAGSIFSSFLTFILNLFFARNLTASDYGAYASLLSLFALAIIPAQSILTVMIKFATSYLHRDKNDLAVRFYNASFKSIAVLSLIILMLFLVFSVPIKAFLKIDNLTNVILVGIAICINYLTIPNNAYVQSLLKFSFSSFLLVTGSTIRLIAGIVLVFLGYKVFGALMAILLAGLVSFLLGFIPIRFLFVRKDNGGVNIRTKEIVSYALPACISIFALTSLTAMDVILVRHFFSPTQAGYYGGLSLIGKVIFYFTAVGPSVMFPLVVKRHTRGENIVSLFYLAIFLVIIPSIAITCFYYIFPNFSIWFFLGKNYLNVAPYLGMFGVYVTIIAILNVCVNFFLSIGKTRIFIPIIIATILHIVLISVFHNSFYQVIGVSIGIASMLLTYLLIFFAKKYMSLKSIKSYFILTDSSGL